MLFSSSISMSVSFFFMKRECRNSIFSVNIFSCGELGKLGALRVSILFVQPRPEKGMTLIPANNDVAGKCNF
jgi:hypothetical protein